MNLIDYVNEKKNCKEYVDTDIRKELSRKIPELRGKQQIRKYIHTALDNIKIEQFVEWRCENSDKIKKIKGRFQENT